MIRLLRYLLAAALVFAPLPNVRAAGVLLLAGGGGGGATLTYTLTDSTQAININNASPYAGINIGTVAADRYIVLSLFVQSNAVVGCENGGGSSGPAPDVKIGSTSMTVSNQLSENSNACHYIYGLACPSACVNATTATVTLTGFNLSRVGFVVGTITGSATTSFRASNGSAWGGGGSIADPRGVTGDLAAVAYTTGDVSVIIMGIDRGTTMSVNSGPMTIDANSTTAGTSTQSTMYAHGTTGSPNFNGASNFNLGINLATFKP